MADSWSGKTVLVCGASAGLGYQLAMELTRQNARVILAARNLEKLETVKTFLMDQFQNMEVHVFSADLADAQSVLDLATEIHQQFGRLDLVINAVGESDRGSIGDLQCDRLVELFRRNVCSSLLVTQRLAPLLGAHDQQSEGGVLVLIGSLSAHFAPRYLGGYSIVKHGVAALAQQARLELAADRIHVMLASPGPIARPDTGTRYDKLARNINVPAEALQGGGGAKIKGLDPLKLSQQILDSAARRKNRLIRPRKASLLLIASSISSRLGDFLLRRLSS